MEFCEMAPGHPRKNPPVDETKVVRVERTTCQHIHKKIHVGTCPGLIFFIMDEKWGQQGIVWAFPRDEDVEAELLKLAPIFGDKKLEACKPK